PYPLNGYMVMV
ncbi:hypothetical protein CFOL_v3_11228, partial [Cephalotus follicularis]